MEEIKGCKIEIPLTYLQGYNTENFFGLSVNRDIGQTFKSGTQLLIRKTKQAKPGDYVILQGDKGLFLRRILVDYKNDDCYLLHDPSMSCGDFSVDKESIYEMMIGTVFLSITPFENPLPEAQPNE